MVKGVSQQVIEVSRTENVYFEKAILFLRTSSAGMDRKDLDDHAQAYLRGLQYRKQRESKAFLQESLRFLTGMALGGLLTWLLISANILF